MQDSFSEGTRIALFCARLEISAEGGTMVEPEHLLLGLLAAKGGIAHSLLIEADIEPRELRRVVRQSGAARPPMNAEVPLAEACKRALESASAEAKAMLSGEVTTGHLLIGLLCDPASSAAEILRGAKVEVDFIRHQVMEMASAPERCASDVAELIEQRLSELGLD